MNWWRVILLFPFSILYGLIIAIRNLLYNRGVFRTQSFRVPIVCIGNISVGGTGKTPHVEYLLRRAGGNVRIGLISRGYRRKSSGLLLARPGDGADVLGDEPCQILTQFPQLRLAVDGNRRRGIEALLNEWPDTELIVMDDGFQHRAVRPNLAVVLVDFSQLPWNDYMLPAGNLRDQRHSLRRADLVVVTKTPDGVSIADKQMICQGLSAYFSGKVLFSGLSYGEPVSVFPAESKGLNSSGIAFSGLANPAPFVARLGTCFPGYSHHDFPDHYHYSVSDVARLASLNPDGCLITTAKDAVKLRQLPLEKALKEKLFYIPVEVVFHHEDGAVLLREVSRLLSRDCFE